MNNEKIGFIGLGNMGHPMAKNLEKAGFQLFVYNRSLEKTEGFKENSTVCKNIKEIVEKADIIFTMLTNDKAVGAVYEDILRENITGKLFIDMSTISPEVSVSTSKSIIAKGAAFIDAPVAGSTKPAADGTLIIMIGGKKADLERAKPYLEKLGKEIKYLGENGKGIAAKLSINYFISALFQSLAETILLSDKLGIERKDMLEIINASASGSQASKIKTHSLVNEDYAPAFALDLMLKDVLLAVNAGADFPMSKVLAETYQSAHDKGFGGDDVIGIIQYLQKNQKN
ncbi:MAG: NAD(P)-dependent oxidoreductase [Chryseobacterium sp.]|nr:NAD(P)-dependent oxidoreductase [Chryseobacterium sp.]